MASLHVVWRFYLETGYRGGAGNYQHYQCNTEEEVDAFLADNPGWRVMERINRGEWERRTDLEMRGSGR